MPRKTTGTREHLSSCKSVSVASEYSIEVLKELNRHVLIAEQDKADHSRLAFMPGTKQRQQESLKASDNTLFFYVPVVTEAPAPFCWPPGRRRGKGRGPSRASGKQRGGQSRRDRRNFQRFEDCFQHSNSNESQRDLAFLFFFLWQPAMKPSLPAPTINEERSLEGFLNLVASSQSWRWSPCSPSHILQAWTCVESLSHLFLKLI